MGINPPILSGNCAKDPKRSKEIQRAHRIHPRLGSASFHFTLAPCKPLAPSLCAASQLFQCLRTGIRTFIARFQKAANELMQLYIHLLPTYSPSLCLCLHNFLLRNHHNFLRTNLPKKKNVLRKLSSALRWRSPSHRQACNGLPLGISLPLAAAAISAATLYKSLGWCK